MGLNPAQIPAAVASIVIGVLIAIIFQLDYAQTLPHLLWPFSSWMLVSRNKPGRFIAQFSRKPQFKRQRRRRQNHWN